MRSFMNVSGALLSVLCCALPSNSGQGQTLPPAHVEAGQAGGDQGARGDEPAEARPTEVTDHAGTSNTHQGARGDEQAEAEPLRGVEEPTRRGPPEVPLITLAVGGTGTVARSATVDLMEDDDLMSTYVLAAAVTLTRNVSLWLEGARSRYVEDSLGEVGIADPDLRVDNLAVAAQYALPDLVYPVAAIVKVGLGAQRGILSVEVDEHERREGEAWAARAYAATGIRMCTTLWGERGGGLFEAPRVGFQLELGYLWVGDMDFDHMVAVDPREGSTFERKPLDMGPMDISGFTYRLLAFLNF